MVSNLVDIKSITTMQVLSGFTQKEQIKKNVGREIGREDKGTKNVVENVNHCLNSTTENMHLAWKLESSYLKLFTSLHQFISGHCSSICSILHRSSQPILESCGYTHIHADIILSIRYWKVYESGSNIRRTKVKLTTALGA